MNFSILPLFFPSLFFLPYPSPPLPFPSFSSPSFYVSSPPSIPPPLICRPSLAFERSLTKVTGELALSFPSAHISKLASHDQLQFCLEGHLERLSNIHHNTLFMDRWGHPHIMRHTILHTTPHSSSHHTSHHTSHYTAIYHTSHHTSYHTLPFTSHQGFDHSTPHTTRTSHPTSCLPLTQTPTHSHTLSPFSRLSEGADTVYTFDMAKLHSHLLQKAATTPGASYHNLLVLKYEVRCASENGGPHNIGIHT